jgi:hypothetical protein
MNAALILEIHQSLSAVYYIVGIVGSLLPTVAPSWLPLSQMMLYGRLFDADASAVQVHRAAISDSWPTRLVASFSDFVRSYVVRKSTAFLSFYVLGTIVALALSAVAARAAYISQSPGHAAALVWLFAIHTQRRIHECLYIAAPSSAKVPFALAVFGGLHYLFAPATLLPAACGGFVNIIHGANAEATYLCGLCLFVVASLIQARVHDALGHIGRRARSRARAGHHDYPLPTARDSYAFTFCLAPHYTAEVLLYAGLLLMRVAAPIVWPSTGQPEVVYADHASHECAGGPVSAMLISTGPLLMLTWTMANLSVTAARTALRYELENSSQIPPSCVPRCWCRQRAEKQHD